MLKRPAVYARFLLALFCLQLALPAVARADWLYINLKLLRVEDKKLGSGCELTLRHAFDGDKMVCTDPDGNTVYYWHKIPLKMMYGAIQRTCEISVVKENHKAFHYRWHAIVTPGSAYCKMHWANDNTLDVEPGVR